VIRFGNMAGPGEPDDDRIGIVDAWLGLCACLISAAVMVGAGYGIWTLWAIWAG
jgi:hypothetical protein